MSVLYSALKGFFAQQILKSLLQREIVKKQIGVAKLRPFPNQWIPLGRTLRVKSL